MQLFIKHMCIILVFVALGDLCGEEQKVTESYYQQYARAVDHWKSQPIIDAKKIIAKATVDPADRMAAIDGSLMKSDLKASDVVFFLRWRYDLVLPMGPGAQLFVVTDYVKRCPVEWGVKEIVSFARINNWELSEQEAMSAFRIARQYPSTAEKSVSQ